VGIGDGRLFRENVCDFFDFEMVYFGGIFIAKFNPFFFHYQNALCMVTDVYTRWANKVNRTFLLTSSPNIDRFSFFSTVVSVENLQ